MRTLLALAHASDVRVETSGYVRDLLPCACTFHYIDTCCYIRVSEICYLALTRARDVKQDRQWSKLE